MAGAEPVAGEGPKLDVDQSARPSRTVPPTGVIHRRFPIEGRPGAGKRLLEKLEGDPDLLTKSSQWRRDALKGGEAPKGTEHQDTSATSFSKAAETFDALNGQELSQGAKDAIDEIKAMTPPTPTSDNSK